MADLLYINSADPPSKQATDINYNFSVVESSGGGSTVTSADITDATTIGREVLTAASAAAARTAIGAGTSNLVLGTTATTALAGNTTLLEIGTTASTAAAGNHTHTAATTAAAGFMSAADKVKLDAVPTPSTILRLADTKPSSSSSPGEVGQIFPSSTFLYVCVDKDSWVRVAVVLF